MLREFTKSWAKLTKNTIEDRVHRWFDDGKGRHDGKHSGPVSGDHSSQWPSASATDRCEALAATRDHGGDSTNLNLNCTHRPPSQSICRRCNFQVSSEEPRPASAVNNPPITPEHSSSIGAAIPVLPSASKSTPAIAAVPSSPTIALPITNVQSRTDKSSQGPSASLTSPRPSTITGTRSAAIASQPITAKSSSFTVRSRDRPTAAVAAATPVIRLNSDDIGPAMHRKVWVKRPGASATRVEVQEEDLVDNVRDVILHKYANSLGKSIDSPDVTLKIVSREQANKNVVSERVLSPEENISRVLDAYYPGGQTMDEALVIEVPQRRTPRPSPRPGNHMQYYIPEEYRPGEAARDYFPPMPLNSPRLSYVPHTAMPNNALPAHSMSVLTTGQVPPLPSPGTHGTRRHARPKYGRQHTSSPTIMHTSQPNGIAPMAAPLPTPPAQADHKSIITPPNRTTSPHPGRMKKKKTGVSARDPNAEPVLPSTPASAGLLDGRVPPINVLIVEDNVINLRLLEQFMRRLKVRWKSAMNGKEAVSMWRQGGFHLVLMDIQLPVMNGLDATKEIRRLESVNGIGLSVFADNQSQSSRSGAESQTGEVTGEDRLEDRSLFKSPVIIVALTASSLQSDRHEALAVGCNDFLTKPVNFGWMERKVTEWGCMQALIDFDGWRKWKEIEAKKNSMDPEARKQEEKEEKAKAKAALRAMFSRPPPVTSSGGGKKEDNNNNNTEMKKDEKEKNISDLAGMVTSPVAMENGFKHQQTNSGQSPMNSHSRRGHRNTRNGGSISNLPATVEVDEKS